MELHNWFMERRDWIIHLKNPHLQLHTLYSIYGITQFNTELHDHGVPWLIMELRNCNYMSSIDNYGTPYSFTFTFCPVGFPYALNKRTGLILAEYISLNIYDTKVWANIE